MDAEEIQITQAILEAAQAIAKTCSVLVQTATGAQQDFIKLIKEPKTSNLYKRDIQWAQGLIAAAKTVSGAVQDLVKAAGDAAEGNSAHLH